MAQIGLKNLFYAPISSGADEAEIYGAPVRLAKAISADISVNTDAQTLFADDGADVVINEFINGTITLGINDLGNAKAAALLGASLDSNGVLVSSGEDTPPAVAIGFQSRSATGGDRYIWLYRVVFAIPNQTLQTKGESVTFSTPSIVGTFSRRNKAEASGKHLWKAEVKDGDAGVSATTIANWFASVYTPGSTNDAVLSTLALTGSSLSPTFNAGVTQYTGTASAATGTITATAGSGRAVAIVCNGTSYASGGTVTWATGENVIHITVTNGTAALTYTVIVTKAA